MSLYNDFVKNSCNAALMYASILDENCGSHDTGGSDYRVLGCDAV
jgi:hypothetical protein